MPGPGALRKAEDRVTPAFGYVRQSKTKAEDEGDSLSCAMQADQIRRWAAGHGYEIVHVYEDQDISGRTDNRPAYRQLLSDIRDRRDVAAVITYKYSRFARSVRVFANGHGELQDRGVALLSATESADTRMVQMSALIADWYSTDLAEYVSAAVRQKMRRGGWHGRVPFGYVRDGPTQRLVPDPVPAAFVAEVFDRVAGGATVMEIVRWIRHDPALAEFRGGRSWSWRSVAGILHNRAYLGHTSEMEDAHPPLVDRAVFDAVQRRLTRQRTRQAKTISSPLEELVTCGGCGLPMHLHTLTPGGAKGNVYPRSWQCSAKGRTANYGETYPAHQQTFRADWIEDAVRVRLAADLAGRATPETAIAHARTQAGSDTAQRRRVALERQRRKAQDGQDRLLALYRDGRLDADRWLEADREAAAQVAVIDAELATLPAPPDPATYHRAAAVLGDAAQWVPLTSNDPATQAELDTALRRFLLEVGARITIDARPPLRGRSHLAPTVTITYAPPYATLIRIS